MYKIPWSTEEENRMLELREQNLEWDEIATQLNTEFKHLRPVDDESGKRMKRTGDSILWHDQNIKKRLKKNPQLDENGNPIKIERRPKRASKPKIIEPIVMTPVDPKSYIIEIREELENKPVMLLRLNTDMKIITSVLKQLM